MKKQTIINLFVSLLVFLLTFNVVRQQKSNPPLKEEIPQQLRETDAYHALKWYNDQRAYPTGTIPKGWREKALEHIKQNNLQKSSAATSLSWLSQGPNNFGGRTRSIAINPTNANIIYCGSVSGGVWKTTDGGASWQPKTDNAANLAISSIVIDPFHPDTVYAGTGEGYFPIDALRGAGVLKSTDGGSTWTQQTSFSSPNPNYSYYYITKLVIHPYTPNVVYAGMIGGIWKTTNGGTSWSKLTFSPLTSSIACTDLVADPSHPDTMYAAFGLFSTDGIYKTTNGGTNWSKLTNGFPATSTKYNRISLAVSPSNTQIIYASLSDSNYYTHSIQKSTDGGASWSAVATPFDSEPLVNNTHLGGQGWYNNIIAVNPTNSNIVYAGGINVFKSTSGGASWSRITDGYGSPYIHVDQHVITFNPSNPSIMYFGNDGGVFTSTDGGSTFSSLNNGLVTIQFYSCAVHPTSNIFYAGAQDNGTLKYDGSNWTQVLSGDGGPCAVDSVTPTTVYGSYVWLQVFKSINSGANWSTILNQQERSSFIAPLAIAPSNSQILVGGTYRMYRTTNGGSSWKADTTDLTGDGGGTAGASGSTISAIGLAKTTSATIYMGTSGEVGGTSSRIWVTTNANAANPTWSNITKSPLPNLSVSSIAVDRSSAAHAYVTFSGYGAGHVFVTANTGGTWTNISGDLPDIPTNTIALDPINTNHLVIGTDLGIFETTNGGTNWIQQNSGLANVSVAQLVLRTGDGILFAATHGRGLFKTSGPLAVHESPSQLPTSFVLHQNYPNPFNPSTVISYQLKVKSFVSLKVYDMLGQEVQILVSGTQEAGTQSVIFNATNLASGVYLYRLSAGNYSEEKKMLFLK